MQSATAADTELTRHGLNTPVEDADLHASSEEYANRFRGPVGEWMLQVQERAFASMLKPEMATFLDVGGGHGQIAVPLSQWERAVTVLGSSPACGKKLQTLIETGSISFKSGNLVELPFEPRSFDVVVSFRLMSHCTAWRRLIGEMCRVADQAVIFDYPVWCSANFLTPLLFSIKRRIEGNTRTYRIFTTRELTREFRKYGFKVTSLKKQFLFPMGLHRALKNPRLSNALEGIARTLLLSRLFGSPVIIRFEREGAHDK